MAAAMYGMKAIAMITSVAMITAAAPRKTAAAALIRDQPRLRRARTNGAKVAATIAATRIETVTVDSKSGDLEEHQPEGDRHQQPPADRRQALEPAGDETRLLRRGRRDVGHCPSSLLHMPHGTRRATSLPCGRRRKAGFAVAVCRLGRPAV